MPCARSQITKSPKPFVSPSLDWLNWLGLARLASAWLVSSAAATRTATTPEQAYITIGAALRAAAMVVDACSGVVAVVVAAADETSHAEARLARPSQASQSREGLTNGFGYFCDDGSVIRHRACLITKPPILDKSNDLIRGRQEGGIVHILYHA